MKLTLLPLEQKTMKKKHESILAWHFVGPTLRDGSTIPPDGKWLHYPGQIKFCLSGLHASREPFDALQYAPDSTLCHVECREIVVEDHDKFVCRSRRIIARMDATEMLRYYTRMLALSVIHLWEPTETDIVLDYLMTGDESIRRAAFRQSAWAIYSIWESINSATCTLQPRMSNTAARAAWAASASVDAADRTDHTAASMARWAALCVPEVSDARAEFNSLVYECFGKT